MESTGSGGRRADMPSVSLAPDPRVLAPGLRIEEVTDAERLSALEAIQVLVWGSKPQEIVPVHVLQVAATTGGTVLVAYDDSTPIGFAFGFLGRQHGYLYHASHMLGIHPDYQGHGIGAALKWAQRDRALAQGLDLMTWTFDPLESRNAYFNLHKLGVISRTYKENIYGELDDDLNRGLPSDRLLVEWRLRDVSPTRMPESGSVQQGIVVLDDIDGRPKLLLDHVGPGDTLLVRAPRNVQHLKHESPQIALEWRTGQRTAFAWALQRGYLVRDFIENTYILKSETNLAH